MKITWSRNAMRRIKVIVSFYRETVSVPYSRKVRKQIFDKTKYLNIFPEMGIVVEDFLDDGVEYRSIVESQFRIVYRIFSEEVLIVDIIDMRRKR